MQVQQIHILYVHKPSCCIQKLAVISCAIQHFPQHRRGHWLQLHLWSDYANMRWHWAASNHNEQPFVVGMSCGLSPAIA